MGTAPPSRILLCAECAAAVDDVRALLETQDFTARWHAPEAAASQELTGYDLVIVHSGPRDAQTLQLCQGLRNNLADRWLPVLLITPERNPVPDAPGLEGQVDAWLVRPFTPEALLGQVNTILRWKRRHDGMADKAAQLRLFHEQLHTTYRELDQNLELCRGLHEKLLPRTLPHVPPIRFAVRYRRCGRIGGDLYHVFRPDEDRVGFYLADVVGHGVSASLFTLFLKLAVSCNEVSGWAGALVPPHEVLEHVNRELLDLAATDNPLLTMVYALFDRRDNCLSFARAGSPHPIYVPRVGEPQLCQVEGTLLGVFDTQFTTKKLPLRCGDKVLFHSDGLEPRTGHGALLADGDPAVTSSTEQKRSMSLLCPLVERYRELPVQEFVERLFADVLPSNPIDDFTLLGLEVGD